LVLALQTFLYLTIWLDKKLDAYKSLLVYAAIRNKKEDKKKRENFLELRSPRLLLNFWFSRRVPDF